ncbi:heparinase II/III domain-containing protein [Pseudarthrobacter sp. H2]|uniref:heparinase II/III domain-containing protein n=1 Tax=Pseudarthrobacter sp. H2 TaxID=3418415 RepID=UPI003CE6E85D
MHESIQTEICGRATKIGDYVASDIDTAPAPSVPFNKDNCSGNGELEINSQAARMAFAGNLGTYEFRVKFERGSIDLNGLTSIYCLDGWDSIAYLAIGHTVDRRFRHIKIRHVIQDEWQVTSFFSEDLAYLVQNSFEAVEPSAVVDLRLYVKGTPSREGAGISVAAACNWQSVGNELFVRREVAGEGGFHLVPPLRSCLTDYLRGTNESLTGQVRTFLDTGKFPIHGEIALDWGIRQSVPDHVADNPTFRYIWHSLYPAAYMAVYAGESQDDTALHSARDLVVGWLRDNYYQASSDMRYAWYDHGTAERLISLLVILDSIRQSGSDVRFIAQMEDAIRSHAQLLESDSFYAANQNSRFHNHAWFQDIALMAAGIANPYRPEGRRWIDKAKHRLSRQFEELIVRDAGYAVFAENSIGYHHGIQSLVLLAGRMIELSGGLSDVSEVAAELDLWSEYLRYPDRRSPAQGDTFNLANPEQIQPRARVPYEEPKANLLPLAGYGIAKGNHEEKPFMICFFATSRSKTHKHQDNLSFTLFFDGIEWLVDPSFYSHDYLEPVPAYLRSAWAHNAVAVVGQEQSIEPHLAMLDGAYTEFDFEFKGAHRAYPNLLVRRELHGSLTELNIGISDSVLSDASAQTQIDSRTVFHLAEGVVPTRVPNGVILAHPNSEHRLLLSCDVPPTTHYGLAPTQEETSVIGTSFGRYEDSYSLHFPHEGSKPLHLTLTVVTAGSV